MNGALAHLQGLWGRWWAVPGLIHLAYAGAVLVFGQFRPEHVAVTAIALILAYTTAKTRQFYIDVIPYLAVAIGYDSVRYLRPYFVTEQNVWACGLRDFELSLFPAGENMTFMDFFAVHNHPAFDVLFSVPYAVFAYVALVYAGYLFFVDRPRMRHFLWAFMLANFMSFSLWLITPAAPPWYIREFGCTIHLDASPSAGAALLRVDELFGVDYFKAWYSRTTSVYGAMPSMHCAYPMLGLLTAWKSTTWKTRPLHILYVAWMISAAVYLDHHWIVDGIAGWAIAAVAVLIAGRIVRRFRDPSQAATEVVRVENGAVEGARVQSSDESSVQ